MRGELSFSRRSATGGATVPAAQGREKGASVREHSFLSFSSFRWVQLAHPSSQRKKENSRGYGGLNKFLRSSWKVSRKVLKKFLKFLEVLWKVLKKFLKKFPRSPEVPYEIP